MTDSGAGKERFEAELVYGYDLSGYTREGARLRTPGQLIEIDHGRVVISKSGCGQ